MKTMFKLPQLCGMVLLFSCTTDVMPPESNTVTTPPPVGVVQPPVVSPPTNNNFADVIPDLFPFMDVNKQYFIKEKISYNSSMNIDALFSSKITLPDMGEIVKSGEKVNMVAIGGSMTAGFRNGGLYRAGQMTAYPNLVARQMGITDFQSPLFGENEANGTGYVQLIDDGSKYPTWREVTNNKATLKAGSPPELSKYEGGILNNYAVPEGGLDMIFSKIACDNCTFYNGKSWTNGIVFASRMSPSPIDIKKVSLLDQMKKRNVNFFIAEDDFDKFLYSVKDDVMNSLSGYGSYFVNTRQGNFPKDIKSLMSENVGASKGVVFTFPIITDLAYFNWYSVVELKDKANSLTITTERYNRKIILDKMSNFILKPTPTVDALFKNLKKGDNISTTLSKSDLLEEQETISCTNKVREYNSMIRQKAKDANLALVDLEKIYAQMNINSYLSSDGFKVTGGGRGNFFSSDGIYPSAIGQAVIANEVIKSINSTYKSNIPLINLNDYSKTVGKE